MTNVPAGVLADAATLAFDGIVTLARFLTLSEWLILAGCLGLLAATYMVATTVRPFHIEGARR